MRYHLPLFALPALVLVLYAPPARACGPCGSGVDLDHIEKICRQDLWATEVSCIRSTCATPCADWIAGLDACAAGSDPACVPPQSEACNTCLVTPDPSGCQVEVSACGYDTTGGITCASWFTAGGDAANLMPYVPLNYAIALSDYACPPSSPSCPACTAACVGGPGGYLDPTLATFSCGVCLGSSSAGAACLGS